MKNFINKFSLFAMVVGFLMLSSCGTDQITDPNNPSLASVTNNASKAELQTLVTGLEARHRGYYGSATQMFGSFGREVWAFFASDPRFINDWLGIGLADTYPDFFASAGTYVTPYLAVKQANVLIAAAEASSNLTADEVLTYTGFAKTIKGHQLLYPLMQQFNNGIRVDVEDPNNPGPILDFNNALTEIRAVLKDGYDDLDAAATAGVAMPFTLTSGYANFNTPADLAEVNRAIAARAALYAGAWQDALDAVAESFAFDPVTLDDLQVGPAHVYGEAPDVNNPLFYEFDRPTNTILVVHPAMIEDAIAGDARLNKFALRSTVTNSTLSSDYQDARWATNTSSIPYIRNEELYLIGAEALARLNRPTDAVDAINFVRNVNGIGNYTGPTMVDDLITEILFQRRYSLWAEAGHRWVDLRRTGRLDAANVDLRDGGTLFTQVAKRTSETP